MHHRNHPLLKTNRLLITRRLLLAVGSLFVAGQLQAAFSLTKGNLYVYQIGDGNTNGYGSTTAAAPIYIDQFSTNGSLLNQVELPTNGAVTVIASLNSATEGSLSLAPAGNALLCMGYTNNGCFPIGSASVNNSGSDTNTRSILSVTANGTFYAVSGNTNFYKRSAGAGRGAATDGNGNYWAIGSAPSPSGGLNYYGTNVAATNISLTGSSRSIQIYGTNLYFTAGAEMYSVPLANATNGNIDPLTALFTDSDDVNSSTSEGFVFNTNLAICYIAEGSAASGGGIRRFDYDPVNLVWNYSYTISPISIGGNAYAFVTADFTGAKPVVYATTLPANGFGNSIVTYVDTGASAAATTPATVIATAPTNNLNYNGIVFDSIASAAPLPPVRLTLPKMLAGGSFTFSLTNTSGLNFKVYASTNIALASSGWTLLGVMTESPSGSGQYQYSDVPAANSAQRFYQVRWP
jgi:hypothetical protein